MEKINISAETLNKLSQNNQIFRLLEKHEFKKAYSLIINLSDKTKVDSYIEKMLDLARLYIDEILETQNISNAQIILEDFIKNFVEKYSNEINTYYIKKQNLYIATNKLKKILIDYDFTKADTLASKLVRFINKNQYELLKSKYVQSYFENEHNIQINEEQAKSISKTSQNILITARAGSGKTRTIACRAIYALEKENINPEEIMILAFNRKAAEEIRERILHDFNYKKINTYSIRTFHSLAWAIVNPTEEPIWDDRDNAVKQKLSAFIQKLYKSKNIWNNNFKEKLYNIYKNEKFELSHEFIEQGLSQEEIYYYLRDKKLCVTLDGNRVDSNGEKWIADFLFEHDIKYSHSKLMTRSKTKLYKPDFTIWDKKTEINYIIEHWGIDENDSFKQVAKNFRKSWDEYYKEMQWKRTTCKMRGYPLIETSITDMQQGRSTFEKILKERLENYGIKCEKLPKEEILNRIEMIYKDKIAKRFADFIQYAQKGNISSDELKFKLNTIPFHPKNKLFLEIAIELYSEYQSELKKQNKTDFDNVLKEAINKIEQTKGCCEILVGKQLIQIKDINYILIDEFQDFSNLFYNLIESIIKYNPKLKLFCVGDDWQAINGFAGSDLKYFKNFESLYSNSDQAQLLYNYRSTKNIVKYGNTIMAGEGKNAIPYNSEKGLPFEILFVDDINIYKENSNEMDDSFLYDKPEAKYFDIHHRYFKLCYEIIKKHLKDNNNIIIMHRKSKLYNNNDLIIFKNALVDKYIEDLLKKLKELKPSIYNDILKSEYKLRDALSSKIQCNTIHQFKGAEAEVVIILECNNDYYPLIHPDYEIDLIFDRTIKNILEEERRLFYVAVTRAKKQIYFITEKGNESEFLKKLVANIEDKEKSQ